jgi:hypothetical protein
VSKFDPNAGFPVPIDDDPDPPTAQRRYTPALPNFEPTAREISILKQGRENLVAQEVDHVVSSVGKRHLSDMALESTELDVDTVQQLHAIGRRNYDEDDQAWVNAIVNRNRNLYLRASGAAAEVGAKNIGKRIEDEIEADEKAKQSLLDKFLGKW